MYQWKYKWKIILKAWIFCSLRKEPFWGKQLVRGLICKHHRLPPNPSQSCGESYLRRSAQVTLIVMMGSMCLLLDMHRLYPSPGEYNVSAFQLLLPARFGTAYTESWVPEPSNPPTRTSFFHKPWQRIRNSKTEERLSSGEQNTKWFLKTKQNAT